MQIPVSTITTKTNKDNVYHCFKYTWTNTKPTTVKNKLLISNHNAAKYGSFYPHNNKTKVIRS
tara:strand:- start:653 stop:841 length:189 start_codon:yes stop_codon:yes gene_type:complete